MAVTSVRILALSVAAVGTLLLCELKTLAGSSGGGGGVSLFSCLPRRLTDSGGGGTASWTPPPAPASLGPAPLTTELSAFLESSPYSVLSDAFDYKSGLPHKYDPALDLPYFWHVHKSGGSTMKHVMYCLGMAQTRRMDESGCSDSEPELRVCRRDFGMDMEQNVVNADISSIEGIRRAVELGLSSRNFPELMYDNNGTGPASFVVDTSRVYDALAVFSHPAGRGGRLFVLFRHPIERAISKYYYIKIATWERNYKPEVASMSLLEYATSSLCYSDWMTRRLVNKMRQEDELTPADLDLAKWILRRKALVLLTDDMPGSVDRVRRYFGWDDSVLGLDEEHRNCLTTHIAEPMNANPHPPLDTESEEWRVIAEKNTFDLELVSYARELYLLQGEMLDRRDILLRGRVGRAMGTGTEEEERAFQ